ncbi:MAG: DUF6599 family protein [bacterium]
MIRACLKATIGTLILLQVGCGDTDRKESLPEMRDYVPQEVLGRHLNDTVSTYDRETIFDYINGAGEVYLAYDFRKLAVFRLQQTGQPDIIVEMFDMGSTDDAYGIFSHAREEQEVGIGHGYEHRRGLLCFWRARFFVCLLCEGDSDPAEQAIEILAKQIDGRLPQAGGEPELVGCLPEKGLVPHSARFFHLAASLNYHYYLSDRNILNLNRQTQAVLARYDPGTTWLLCIQYPSADEARQSHDSFIESYVPEARSTGAAEIADGKWLAVGQVREYVIVALDAPSEIAARQLTSAVTDKLP